MGSAGPGRLPAPLTTLFGREPDIADLTTAIGRSRLLTLVGAPGCGKTRLAVELGQRTAGSWPGGTYFADLAPLSDEPSVPLAVALALGLWQQPHRAAVDTLVDLLGTSSDPLLLVLDNCEHVVDAVAALVERLVQVCPAVQVLATSRVPLGVQGEQVWEVAPLPAEAATLLFVDRATLASNRFAADGDVAVAAAICERLGRLPLAIELAAASTRMLSPGQILDRLVKAMPLHTGERRPVDPRHATMAATVEWSLRLLSPEVRRLFARLSVFAGTFDLAAAVAVAGPVGDAEAGAGAAGAAGGNGSRAGTGADVEADVIAGLTTLVDQSLVVAEPAGDTMRYRLLEPVRQCLAARLPAGPEGDAVRRRHAEHHLAQALRFDPFGVHGVLQVYPLARIEQNEANLLAALQWARRADLVLAMRLAVAIGPFWEFGGRVNEGRAWMDDLLVADAADRAAAGTGTGAGADAGENGGNGDRGGQHAERAPLRLQMLRGAARLAWRQRDHHRAREMLNECLALAIRAGDWVSEAAAHCTLGMVEFSHGDADRSVEHGEKSLALALAHDSTLMKIWSHVVLGWGRVMQGDHATGRVVLEEALVDNRQFNSPTVLAQVHAGLLFGAFLAGDVAGQREHLVAMLRAMEAGGAAEQGDWLGLAVGLAIAEGRPRSAALLAGGTRAFQQRRGSPAPELIAEPYFAAHAVGTLVDRQEAEGERLSWEELVEEALRSPDAAEPHPLTRREVEVATLLGEGLNNVAIAAELHISRRTVESHVENIKRKLAVTHRHQILTWSLTHLPPR